EPFTVGKANTTTATLIRDETTNADVPPGTVSEGDTVHDTATVGTQVNGFVIGGTVTYNFFNNNGCTGTPATNQTVTLSGGLVPNSAAHGPLAAGSYSFNAVYSGDANYYATPCLSEPFTVGKANTATNTVLT